MNSTPHGSLVLLTGGSGFVGGAISRTLLAAGYRVRMAGRRPATPTAREAQIQFTAIDDLRGPVEWDSALEGVAAVVHAAGAAKQPFGMSDNELFRINVDASESLARAAQRAGVGKFILISSVRAVCGASSPDILTDASPPRPEDSYGHSKWRAEQAVFATGVPAVALRPVVVHGAGARGNFEALAKLARFPLPLPLAAFTGKRSIVSDVNLADAARFCVTEELGHARTLLVADSTPLTVAQICGLMRKALDLRPNSFAVPAGVMQPLFQLLGKGDTWRRLSADLVVSCTELESRGWVRQETSDAGLARMVRWLTST